MQRSVEDILCDRYTQLRRRFHPTYSPGAVSEGAWTKAADLVRSLGVDPELFIEAQFDAMAPRESGKNFPHPNQLYSNFAVANYERHGENRTSTAESMLNQQNELLAAQLPDHFNSHDVDCALVTAALDFKSWFRILMCSKDALPEFKKVWGRCATRQVSMTRTLYRLIEEKYATRLSRFS